MWTATVTREEFVNLLKEPGGTGPTSLRAREETTRPGANEVLLAWSEDPGRAASIPSLIVVDDESLREFLAWAWTYLAGYRPLTAYFRVLGFSLLRSWLKRRYQPLDPPVQSAFVGAILGEAFLSEPETSGFENVSVRACASTFLFGAARAGLVGSADLIGELFQKWKQTHEILKHPPGRLSKDLPLIGSVISSITSGGPRLFDDFEDAMLVKDMAACCLEVQRSSWISPSTLGRFLRRGTGALLFLEAMRGTREQRVIAFEALLDNKSVRTEPPMTAAFVFGYVASLIGPGSLSHVHLLKPILKDFPASVIWYSIFASLYRNSEVLSFNKAIGRRLIRDLAVAETLLTTPRADIALDELRMLLGGEKPLDDFRRGSPSYVVVELLPLVSSSFRWSAKAEVVHPEMLDGPGTDRATLHELNQALNRLVGIVRKLGPEEDPKKRPWKKKKS